MDPICLSTMMAEYYVLSMAMREVIPLCDLIDTVGHALGIDHSVMTNFQVNIWEDNNGCWTLADLEPGQMTPRSKFYDSKVHWFRSYLGPTMKVHQVDTKFQRSDLFTKPCPREVFERLRKMIMGW